MTINIETDIDTQIKKLDEMLKKIELLEDKSKMINFITIDEFAKLRNCSKSTAQKIFRQKSFPSEAMGKQKVIELEALKKWYLEKHEKDESC